LHCTNSCPLSANSGHGWTTDRHNVSPQ
jgi:hypothetical protein